MNKFCKSKKGAILVITALLSTFIIGITAIVVDIGYLYYKRNDLQTAINAAWLAGNDRLMKIRTTASVLTDENKESIKKHIVEVLKYNGFSDESENRLSIIIKDDRDLQISAQKHIGLFFAKIIEVDSTTVAAERTSDSTNAGTSDIIPIVMPHGITKWNQNNSLSFQFFPKNGGFIEGQEYIIKPGQISETSILCQGITNFSQSGLTSNTEYKKNLTYGYTKAINLNEKIGLLCTGYVDETNDSINKRLSNSDNLQTKVIVPIGEVTAETANNYGTTSNLLPIYNLRCSNNKTDEKNIADSAKIIGFAEFELIKESDYKRIGDDYKNGDEGTLGKPTSGQIRGKFIGYLVNPNEILN